MDHSQQHKRNVAYCKTNHFFIVICCMLFSFGCGKRDQLNPPLPAPTAGPPMLSSTTPASAITSGSAVSGGNISNDGGVTVTARGVCWSTSVNPTTTDTKTNDGTGVGIFTSNLTGLLPNTFYHVRAYAINSVATSYGPQVAFKTP